MSNEIIYDKQFIKAEVNGEEVFFPMIYGGSSNCYQFDNSNRGRRSRSWFPLHVTNGNYYGTFSEIIKIADDYRLSLIERYEDYADASFGFHSGIGIGSNSIGETTFGNYKGLFITGCSKALTVEQLLEEGVSVRVFTLIYSSEQEEIFKVMEKTPFDFYPKSSEELLEKIKFAEEYLKDSGVNYHLTIDASEQKMIRIRKKFFPRKQDKKERVEVDKYYVIKIANFGYFLKLKKHGFRYVFYKGGKEFLTEKDAQKYIKYLVEKKNFPHQLVIEEVCERTCIYA